MDLDQLATAVLRLPSADRASLAARLLESLDDAAAPTLSEAEWEAVWAAECARRDAELDADPTLGIPADEVFRRAHAVVDAAEARRAAVTR